MASAPTARSIEQVVQAVVGSGRLLHPKLFSLWQWAQSGGHATYVELIDEKNPQSYNAGADSQAEGRDRGQSKSGVPDEPPNGIAKILSQASIFLLR